MTFTLTPEQADKIIAALSGAESFISGFDDDELQEGIAELLTELDDAQRILMPWFHAKASYVTPRGTLGVWQANVQAVDLDEAMRQAERKLRKGKSPHAIQKLSLEVAAYERGYVPSSEEA